MRIHRRGTTLLEVMAAIILLGSLTTIMLQAVVWRGIECEAIHRRQIALVEAANVMERLAATEWKSLTTHAATETPLSPISKHWLPKGTITSEVQATVDSPAGKRISVEVKWLNQAGEFERPVKLTTWRYEAVPVSEGDSP